MKREQHFISRLTHKSLCPSDSAETIPGSPRWLTGKPEKWLPLPQANINHPRWWLNRWGLFTNLIYKSQRKCERITWKLSFLIFFSRWKREREYSVVSNGDLNRKLREVSDRSELHGCCVLKDSDSWHLAETISLPFHKCNCSKRSYDLKSYFKAFEDLNKTQKERL